MGDDNARRRLFAVPSGTTGVRRAKRPRGTNDARPTPPTAVEVAADFEPHRLIQARHLAGFSRRDVATAVGVPAWQICHWESHVSTPVAYQVEKLAAVLDVPVGFFKRGRPMAYLSVADVHFCGGAR